jgi:seryl-tRNA synthetase
MLYYQHNKGTIKMAQTIKELKKQISALRKAYYAADKKLQNKGAELEDECRAKTRKIEEAYDLLTCKLEDESAELATALDDEVTDLEEAIDDLLETKEDEKRTKREAKLAKAADKLRRAIIDSPEANKIENLVKAAKAAGVSSEEINKALLVAAVGRK